MDKAAWASWLGCLLLTAVVGLESLGLLPRADRDAFVLAMLLAVVVTSLVVAARRLPLQNVLLAAVVVASIGGGMHLLAAATGIPFGAIIFTSKSGWLVFGLLPWTIPLLWIVAVLNARGVARLVLRPWRKSRTYGFRVIGLTAALVTLFALGLETFAGGANRYWLWRGSEGAAFWHGAPWVNFMGWLLTTLLILAFATPAMINKKPVKQPPDYLPLLLWLVVNGLFIVVAAANRWWPTMITLALAHAVVTVFAVRGGRW